MVSRKAIWQFISVTLIAFFAHIDPVYARSNLSGLWWDPSESGWGLTIDHQAEFLFVTLFVYGEGGNPTWLVGQLDATSSEQLSYGGPLYTTTGTPLGRPFVSSDTRVTQVGTATFTLQTDNRLSITYSTGSTNVSKTVVRQANKPMSLAGTYRGVSTTGPFVTDDSDFFINASASNLVIRRQAFFAGLCTFTGAPNQFGNRLSITGTFRCSDLSEGTWQTDDMTLQDGTSLIGTVTKSFTSGSRSTFNPTFERWAALRIGS